MTNNTYVLHWREGRWHNIQWHSFMLFRGLGEVWVPLPRVRAGEHYFMVCMVQDGRLFNVHPHRYLVDDLGWIITHDDYFGALSRDEIERYEAFNKRHYACPQTQPLTGQETIELDGFRDRLWQSSPPLPAAMRGLMRTLPALPDEDGRARRALEARGIACARVRFEREDGVQRWRIK